MALNKNKNHKLYFSISEVATLLSVKESLLRFWEREVSIFKIRKSEGGTRQYTQADIDLLRQFQLLVREQGMTLTGAAAKLKANPNALSRNLQIIQRLEAVKTELLAIKAEIIHWEGANDEEEE